MTAAALVRSLRRTLLDTLRPLVDPDRPTALIDFPHYANVGDSAIYLGELAALAALGLRPPAFVCDLRTYDRQALARRLRAGTILLAGGGNLGDLWPAVQTLRETIVRDFPDNAIVQLPQTIHFDGRTALARANAVLSRHARFTALVRDEPSLEVARAGLGVRAVLCPDVAFALGPLARTRTPVRDLLWLGRGDKEAGAAPPPPDMPPREDWLDEPRTPLVRWTDRLIETTARGGAAAHIARPVLRAAYRPLAAARLRRGSALLQSARVVITDRLHGHVLCLLLGIPHVLVADRHDKVTHFHAAWTAPASGVLRAAAAPEAPALARELLARSRPGPSLHAHG